MAGKMDHKQIAGALFDFLGWATTRPAVLRLGASECPQPAVEALKEWAKTRGLSLKDADVMEWNQSTWEI